MGYREMLNRWPGDPEFSLAQSSREVQPHQPRPHKSDAMVQPRLYGVARIDRFRGYQESETDSGHATPQPHPPVVILSSRVFSMRA